MSIIYGVFNRDGRPADADVLATMRAALRDCDPVDDRARVVGNVAFGCLATNDPAASAYAPLPVYHAEQRLLFVAAGRLDNRRAVAEALGTAVVEGTADVELIRRGYLEWGDAAPSKLLGDWSFAAFHVDRQELVLARDHHGCTALDYHVRADRVVFSSNIRGLLALADVGRRPDPSIVVRSLLAWIGSGGTGTQTFYEDIRHVAPAHSVTIGATAAAERRYWFPENVPTRHRRDVREYADELGALLESAVEARLRAHGPVAATLSGGRDSATVAHIAAAQLARRGQRLTTLSHVPLYAPNRSTATSRIGDERPGVEAVAGASGNIDPIFLDSAAISPVAGIRQFLDVCASPLHAAANAYWLLDIHRAAAARDFGALLAGDMGNATISFAGVRYRLPWRVLYTMYGIRSVFTQKVRRPMRDLRQALFTPDLAKPGPHWQRYYVNPRLLDELGFFRLMKEERFVPGAPRSYRDAREGALAIMMIGANPRGHISSLLADRYGVEWRDAAADARVMEYALSIPNDAFFDARGRGANIVRVMMQDRLPESILSPTAKGLQSADIGLRIRACAAEFDELLDQLRRSTHAGTFLDTASLARDWSALQAVTDNRFDHKRINNMLRAAMTGLFLTRFD